MVIFSLLLYFSGSAFAADSINMKIYCSDINPRVSFPFPGQPQYYNDPLGGEAYVFRDVLNINSYQFGYRKYDNKAISNKKYLEGVIGGRTSALKATILSKKIYTSGGKTIAIYSYYYFNRENIKKISFVKDVIYKNNYYYWSVQSYKDYSKYPANYIFKNYSKYLDYGIYCGK